MVPVLPPRSMQQTAVVIITFLAYVSGIRNGGGGGGSSNHHNYASTSFPHAPADDLFSPQSLQEITANTQTTGRFRPSQMLEFTTADATASHQYPPTYEDTNYSTIPIPTQIQSTAEVRNDMEKQFAFPSNDDEEQQAATSNYNKYSNNNNYNYNYQSNGQSASAQIPTQLQSTPILTYHDSYSNENYHYTPTPTDTNNHYQQQQQQQQHYQQQQHRPQEYTVQSSLLVGVDKYGQQQQQQQHLQQSNQQRPTYQQYQRPGYVIDEQLSPSYERPVYTQRPNKYAQYQSQQQQQQHPNALPIYNRELPERRPHPTESQRPQAEEHLSYDSHDYPPPTYFQQLQQQQQQQQSTHPFQSPQRQDSRPPAHATTSPNYANNFGNYLQGGEQYPENYKRPMPSASQPPPFNFVNDQQYSPVQRPPQQRPPPSSSYNPYSEYQQGELPPPPPSSSYNPNYRPPPPNYQPQSQQQQSPSSGLASLASLFTSTQQYAPQFTNLLLGGGGGVGGSSTAAGNPLGSLLGALTGAGNGGGGGGGGYGGSPSRPLNMQVIKALENIARNDDLECVPKVLCQMIAGQTQRGQLPSVITSPAITNFLAGFPAASPAIIYGRAALLGISGGDRSCAQTYAKCPKNEYEILHYLNNHRGGFFKFFSEPEEQTTTQQSNLSGGGGGGASTSLFSILAALAGNSPPPTTTVRPTRRPTAAPSADITSGIGNFFSNVLSEYLGGVEYQRRRRRRRSLVFNDEQEEIDAALEQETETATESEEDFHDAEDDEDTQTGLDMEQSNEQQSEDDVEGRILHHKDVPALDGPRFFPEIEDSPRTEELKNVIKVFNKVNAQRKLKFPSETEVRDYKDVRELDMPQDDEEEEENYRGGKQVHFKDEEEEHRDDKQVHFRDEEEDQRDDKQMYFRDEQEFSKLPADYGVKTNQFDFDAVKGIRYGKKVVFKDTEEEHDQSPQHSGVVKTRHEQPQAPTRNARIVFPDHYGSLIRKGRILNRPEYANTYSDYVRSYDDRDKFVVSDSNRRPHYQGSSGGSSLSINNNYNNNAYLSQSSNSASNTNNYVNYGGFNHNADSNSNRYYTPTTKYPNYVSSANNNYDYPNNNYVSNNRYGSNYASTRTTRRPYVKPQEDDKNVYVTNGRGMTEYYVTPDGRKVYL